MRILGRKAGLGRRTTPEPSWKNRQQSPWTDKAWSSLTLLAEVMASRKAVLTDSHLRSAPPRGSKGGGAEGPQGRPPSPREGSQDQWGAQ